MSKKVLIVLAAGAAALVALYFLMRHGSASYTGAGAQHGTTGAPLESAPFVPLNLIGSFKTDTSFRGSPPDEITRRTTGFNSQPKFGYGYGL